MICVRCEAKNQITQVTKVQSVFFKQPDSEDVEQVCTKLLLFGR